MDLNPEQVAAVNDPAKSLLVIATPGSGKTSVLCERIRRLANTADPKKFLVMTFTNAGARAMTRRLDGMRFGYIGTCHGFAFRLIQRFGGLLGYRAGTVSIMDEEDSDDLLDLVIGELRTGGDAKRFRRNRIKYGLRGDDKIAWNEYLFRMRRNNSVDYDLMLAEAAVLVMRDEVQEWALQYTHLFVDEYQDTAPEEAIIHDNLPCAHKFFCGDGDQSIYGFRGTTIKNILTKAKTAKTIKLPKNYRSTTIVCETASALIRRNRERVPVEIEPTRSDRGTFQKTVFDTDAQELTEICERANAIGTDVAILCRTNELKNRFMAMLGIRETREVRLSREAVQLVRVLLDPQNDLLASRYLRTIEAPQPTAGEAPVSVRARLVDSDRPVPFASLAQALARARFPIVDVEFVQSAAAEYLSEFGEDGAGFLGYLYEEMSVAPQKKAEGITVATVHGAKGLEWATVFMPGCEDGYWRAGDDTEGERRLFYVGLTRAKDDLVVSRSRTRDTKWRKAEPREPSKFFLEV